jgi:thymidylate kinase
MSQGAPPAVDSALPGTALWVGFEGIIASGKTTQSRLLAEHLGHTDVVPEFGDHELGRFLSRFGAPGMRLTPAGCDTGYVRHLLALSSRAQKLRALRSARRPILLDVATMTDAAFALADLPPEARELWPTMVSAVDAVIALAEPPPGVLIYLDCPPAVAAQRLAARTGAPVSPEQVDFLDRMHAAYEFLLRERTDVVRVDADGAVETVAAAVQARVHG